MQLNIKTVVIYSECPKNLSPVKTGSKIQAFIQQINHIFTPTGGGGTVSRVDTII